MDELIKQIIQIEEKAQEVIRVAVDAEDKLENRIEADSRKMQSDIERQMQAKNDSLRSLEAEDAENKISAINADTEKHLSALEEKYRQNKDLWVEKIVSGVIGG